MKKILVLLTLLCAGQLYSMESPQKGPSVAGAMAGRPDYMATLPTELKKEIIVLLTTSKTLEEAIKALRTLTETNKEFNTLTNDPVMIRAIIRLLAQKFNAPSEYIAKKLSTQGSEQYITLSLKLMTALWRQDFAQAENLIKAGADVDFQTADTYPMQCGPSASLNIDAITAIQGLTTLLPLTISSQNNIALFQNVLSTPKLLQQSGMSEDKIQNAIQMYQSNLQTLKVGAQEMLQNTKTIFTDEQTNQLLAKIDDDNFQEALDIIEQAKKYNGIVAYITNDTNTCIIGAGFSLVMYAITSNQLTILKWLINHKADLNVTMGAGDTALLMAISMGQNEIIKLLIKNGANINQQNTLNKETRNTINEIMSDEEYTFDINKINYHNTTLYNQLKNETLESIIFSAIDTPEATPLIRLLYNIEHFTFEELYDLVKLLLDNGANPNKPDADGDTPLIIIATSIENNGSANIMKLLLSYDADPSIKDRDGLIALDHMNSDETEEDPERDEKIQLLKEAMKKSKKNNS